jgi:hypothetical protein
LKEYLPHNHFGIIFALNKKKERASNMKAVNYISLLGILVLSSCASRVYTGLEYDDLYYRPTDQPVAVVKSQPVHQVPESSLQAKDYYDNVYAADTLVSDEYYAAAKKDSTANININYYNFDSYTGRLRNFYGNYFYPYWRDPFYMGMGSNAYYDPWFYYDDPFYYNSFYSYPYYGGMYNWSYGGYYGGYWGGYYGNYWGGLYGGYYPYYSNFYSRYGSDVNPISYGRRELQSNYSSSWNRTMLPATATSRRSGYISEANRNGAPAGRSADLSSVNTGSRRQTPTGSSQITNRTANVSSATRSQGNNSRTEYSNSGRSYTPSYSNPRMSTRPTYNNSRVNTEYNNSRSYSGSESYRSAPSRSSSSVSSGSNRSSSSSSQYSMPSRRSVESGSGYNSGSFSSGRSSSYSSGSESRSYSSGSSGSSSSSSYSSGSSSGGSRSSGGGGGGSSSSRR